MNSFKKAMTPKGPILPMDQSNSDSAEKSKPMFPLLLDPTL